MTRFNPQAMENPTPPQAFPPPHLSSETHPPIGTTPPFLLARRAAEGQRRAAWRLLHQFMHNDMQAISALIDVNDDRLAQNILEFLALGSWAGKSFNAPPSVYDTSAMARLRSLFLPGSKLDPRRVQRVLTWALHDERAAMRANAVYILGLTGKRDLVPVLLEALHDPAYSVRRQAVKALGRTGDASVVPALLRALQSADEPMGSQIFLALMDLGPAAVPALLEESHNDSAWVRWHCMRALGEIGGDRAVPVLVRGLADSDHAVAWMAAKSLPKFGRQIVQPVLELLVSAYTSPWLVETTSYVLGEQCRHYKELRPYLEPVRQTMHHVGYRVATPSAASHALDQLRTQHLLTL